MQCVATLYQIVAIVISEYMFLVQPTVDDHEVVCPNSLLVLCMYNGCKILLWYSFALNMFLTENCPNNFYIFPYNFTQ